LRVQLQVSLSDGIESDVYATARPIFKNHFIAIDSNEPAPEIALAIDRPAGSHFCQTTGETLVIRTLVKTPLETGRRYFQRIGRMNEVFDVQDRANVQTYFRTILVSHSRRLVDEDANDGLIIRAGDFSVYQFESVIYRDSLSKCLYSLFNRTRAHNAPSKKAPAQKKKWARTHRTIPPRFEQVVNYT
jgi:hypothetical protein